MTMRVWTPILPLAGRRVNAALTRVRGVPGGAFCGEARSLAYTQCTVQSRKRRMLPLLARGGGHGEMTGP